MRKGEEIEGPEGVSGADTYRDGMDLVPGTLEGFVFQLDFPSFLFVSATSPSTCLYLSRCIKNNTLVNTKAPPVFVYVIKRSEP